MSATNATINYSFPIFIGTDKPAWLVDWNGAMTDIDAAIKNVDTDLGALETTVSGLSTTVAAHTSSISTISGQITTITTNVNSNTGAINTINSLIGNGTPTTTDQTIIGAINELNAGKAAAADVSTVVATVTADGVKTYATLLTELFTGIGALTPKAMVVVGNSVFHCMNVNDKVFVSSYSSTTAITMSTLDPDDYRDVSIANGGTLTVNDRSATAATNGTVFTLYN